MSQPPSLIEDLTGHLTLCQQALNLAEQENSALRNRVALPSTELNESKKELLSRLSQSLERLRNGRVLWQKLRADERRPDEAITPLLTANQDLMLRALVLSRENERLFLERGLFAPRHLPSVNTQRPHFVADLYRRNITSATP